MNMFVFVGANAVRERTYFLEWLNNPVTIGVIRLAAAAVMIALILAWLRYKQK